MEIEYFEMKSMIADYMEKGFLENIVVLFKHDKNLYGYVGDLMADERIRVRIGVAALMESLKKDDTENVLKAVPHIIPLLKNQNPVIRGDAAYLLGIIGHTVAIPYLKEKEEDEDSNVRVIAKEAIEDIRSDAKSS
jgi:HEAT repeat protein